MSRFADRAPRAAAALLLAVGLATAVPASTATGAPDGHELPLIPHTFDLRAVTVDQGGAVRVATHKRSIDAVLDANVLFAKDSAALQPAANQKLQTLTEQLRAAGPGELQIIGYTDDLGSAAHGLDLSKRRAQAVAAQLEELPEVSITVTGRGEQDPRVPNSDEAHRAQNRRVEIHFTAA